MSHSLRIVQRTNHYPIMNGWVYQDCLCQLPDGSLAMYSIPDHKLGAA